MKLKEWIAIWQEKYDAPSVRKTTCEAHRYILQNHIVPRLGEYELTELTTEDVEHFLADCKTHGTPRRKEPLSDVTMRHIWTLLAGILNQAVADGVIAENPAKGFLHKQPKQVQAAVLMKWEIDAYLNAAEELGYLPIFTLALSYGLRQRELIALKWSDLDTGSRTLTIHEQRVVECGKLVEYEGQTRVLQLSQYDVGLLVQKHQKHPSSEVMFIHPGTLNPYPPNMVRLLHKRVLEHAGLDRIRFETLRHTCAIRAIEDGHDVRTLSAKLGHSRPVTTRRSYSDCLPQAQ